MRFHEGGKERLQYDDDDDEGHANNDDVNSLMKVAPLLSICIVKQGEEEEGRERERDLSVNASDALGNVPLKRSPPAP